MSVERSQERFRPTTDPGVLDTVDKQSEFFPTNYVSRDDLIRCWPELEHQVQSLDASEIENIADKVGDALQETYWTVLEIVLKDYLGGEKMAD